LKNIYPQILVLPPIFPEGYIFLLQFVTVGICTGGAAKTVYLLTFYHELLASVTLLVLTEPCEFLVHGCVVNFCNPGLDLAEITVKATVKDYR
jgi:hypothetical protein